MCGVIGGEGASDRHLLQSPFTGKFLDDFLILTLNYLKRVHSSEPLHTKIHLIHLLLRQPGCMGTNRNLFRQTGFQKCERVNNDL